MQPILFIFHLYAPACGINDDGVDGRWYCRDMRGVIYAAQTVADGLGLYQIDFHLSIGLVKEDYQLDSLQGCRIQQITIRHPSGSLHKPANLLRPLGALTGNFIFSIFINLFIISN